MPIIRYRPMWGMEDFDKFFEDMPNLPEKMTTFTPAVDVYQDKNNVVVETPLAGVDPEKVNDYVENDVLKIEDGYEQRL